MLVFPVRLDANILVDEALRSMPGYLGPVGNMAMMPNSLPAGYGFSLAPLFDPGGEFINHGQNPSTYPIKWLDDINANLPGSLPVYVNLTFEDGSTRFVRVSDDRLHNFGGKKFIRADLYFPLKFAYTPPFGADLQPASGTPFPIMPSYLLAYVLDGKDDWYEIPRSKGRAVFSPLEIAFNGTDMTGNIILPTLTSVLPNGLPNPSATPYDIINFFGWNDVIAGQGIQAGKAPLGAFYVFQNYRRFRMALWATAAQDILICSAPAAYFSNFSEPFRSNEKILAAQWIADPDGSGNFNLVLERECQYADEWVLVYNATGGVNVNVGSFAITFEP